MKDDIARGNTAMISRRKVAQESRALNIEGDFDASCQQKSTHIFITQLSQCPGDLDLVSPDYAISNVP
jgi:hypothetical protein